MQTNNHKLVNYDEVLDNEFGKVGTPEREKAEKLAYSFFMHSSPIHKDDEREQDTKE